MSPTIRFGTYFDENTTVEEIFKVFAKDNGKLYKSIMDGTFGSTDCQSASLVAAALSFFAGIRITDSARFGACGYGGAVSSWAQNVFNGCFGSSLQYANHPNIQQWRDHVRALLEDIYKNREHYTAGDVYDLIASDPLWSNSYSNSVGNKQKTYYLDIARKNLLGLISDPENFVKTPTHSLF